MGYSGYESTPPRPFRILAGGLLALVCAALGTLHATDAFHRATCTSSDPKEIDWDTFLSEGPGDAAFVRIVGVEIHDKSDEPDALAEIDELEELLENFDPESPEQVQALMESHFSGADPVAAVLGISEPPKVIPVGMDPEQVPARLTLSYDPDDLIEAKRQTELDLTLTGLLSRRTDVSRVRFGSNENDTPEDPSSAQSAPVYEIEPLLEVSDTRMASTNFLFAGMGLAFGLILCCSGGASIYTLWYFPLPSIMSLAGYPMRYGRGGTATRAIYFIVGAVLMAYGYRLMVSLGNFGTLDGIPLFQAIGFNVMFIGVAACMSVPCQILSRQFFESMDVQPQKKEKRLTFEQACSLEPVKASLSEYADDHLGESAAVLVPQGLTDHIDRLVAAGFTMPGKWVWHRGDEVLPAAIQLGCQEMIVSDLEWSTEQQLLRTRLVSVLGDGMAVVTVSSAFDVSDSKTGESAVYQKAMSDEPAEMLAMHLEKVVSLAEERGTSVIAFEENEARSVAKLGRRALASVRSEHGEVLQAVGESKYGRFSFPPQEVTMS